MLRQGKLEIAYSGVREFLYIYNAPPFNQKKICVCVYKICVLVQT